MPGAEWCYSHSPAHAEKRRQNASQGGKSGGRGRGANNELRAVKDKLLELADDVLAGTVDRSDAAVVSQVLNVYLRSVEIQRRTADLSDLLERLEAVEEAASRLRGA